MSPPESPDSPLPPISNGWFRQQPYFAAFSQPELLQNIMHHRPEPNNIKQSFTRDLLRSIGTQDPFKLFLDLERIKKEWFYAQDTRQISKRKKFGQYVLDTHLLEMIYPKLKGQVDLIRTIINIYRQIQQEAFGIVLINKQNKVFLVQNEKYYWSFPKGKLKLDSETYTFESQWSCALREFSEEVQVDLSGQSPSQYWETRLADGRMVGLFVIEDFDEQSVHFEYDKREIIDIMWFNLRTNNDEMHTLRQYWKEQQRLSDPYYTAIPFIEHLIFEYLPGKDQQSSLFCPESKTPKEDQSSSSSSNSSVINMLLGRIPIWPSPPPPALVSNAAGLELLTIVRQSMSEVSDSVESSPPAAEVAPMSIVDRLHKAASQARWNLNGTHRIAVQA